LQADRLVSDRPRAGRADDDLAPASFPDPLSAAVQGPGLSLSPNRPTTRHGTRKGGSLGERSRRADRTLLLYLAIALVVVVGLGGVAAWLVLGRGTTSTAGTATGNRSVLVALVDGSDLLAAAALGTGGGGASCVLVPPSLVVVNDGRRVLLSGTAANGPAAPAQALARTLNVQVDGGWLITPGGLTSLVDGGGGVVVDVDQELRSGTVLVAAGQGQRLSGAQASVFVTVPRAGEDAKAVQQRFATVLGQVLVGLPTKPGEAVKDLEAVGAESRSSLSLTDLAGLLTTIGASVSNAGLLEVSELPVVAAGAEDGTGAVVADKAVAGNLMRQKLGVGAPTGSVSSSG
jgi:hypothetical protein